METLLNKESLAFEPPELGCVLYLPGLPGGDGKVFDRSPYSNVGTITGATWKRLPGGLWYLSFDGDDDYLPMPASSLWDFGGNDLTLVLWFKLDDLNVEHTIISSDANFKGINLRWNSTSDSKLRLNLSSNGSSWDIANSVVGAKTSWIQGQWYFIAFKRNGSSFEVSVDNVSDITVSSSAPLSSVTSLQFGKFNTAGKWLKGSLAIIRIFNCVLSDLQLINIRNNEKSLFGV